MRVYVAGAYSGGTVIEILENIRKGINLSKDVLLLGHSPFCPWLDYHFALACKDDEIIGLDQYYKYSMDWLDVSDCMLLTSGWEQSEGTKNEIIRAHELKIPVFETIYEMVKLIK